MLLFLSLVAILVNLHGVAGTTCIRESVFDSHPDSYLICDYDCCGERYTRYCCSEPLALDISYSLGGAAIAGIVVGCLVVVAIIVGVILCCVCCVRAASGPSNSYRGAVVTTNQAHVAVVNSGAENTAYAPPPYPSYPMNQPPANNYPISQPPVDINTNKY